MSATDYMMPKYEVLKELYDNLRSYSEKLRRDTDNLLQERGSLNSEIAQLKQDLSITKDALLRLSVLLVENPMYANTQDIEAACKIIIEALAKIETKV